MPTIGQVIRQIRTVEGFDVSFHHTLKGRRVRKDKKHINSYYYEKAATSYITVQQWFEIRFRPQYQGFTAKVLDTNGKEVPANTILDTVRKQYEEAAKADTTER